MIRNADQHYRAPKGGGRFGGKVYREGQRIPARYGRILDNGEPLKKDPSAGNEAVPPGYSRDLIPHIWTFQSLISTVSHVYRNPDEAYKHSIENARFMRNDCSIMECLEARQRMCALLNWHIEPDDKDDPIQKTLADDMTKIMNATPYFTEYRRNLQEALWYGKYAIQHIYGFRRINGKKRVVIERWKPINGDKLAFRFDDGSARYSDEDIGIKVSTVWPLKDVVLGNRKLEFTEYGPAYFLETWERTRICVHKHIIEDGAYEDPISSGRIHGVGIRDRIYWCWFQKQETMAHLMEIIERTGNGFTIYYYPAGNAKAKLEMEEVARAQTHTNVILMPRTPGDPAMDAYGIDRIEPSTAGVTVLQDIVTSFFGNQIKRYILGQTLSSEADATGLGSGVADLHLETLLQIIQYDSVKAEETITCQKLQPLQMYNFPWSRGINLKFVIDTESSESETKMRAFKEAWDMGTKIKAADVYDTIGASMPTEDEEVLQNPAMQQQQRLWDQTHGEGGDPMAGGEDGGPPEGPDGEPDMQGMFGPLMDQVGGQDESPEQYAKRLKSAPGQKNLFNEGTSSKKQGRVWSEEDEKKHPRDAGGEFASKGDEGGNDPVEQYRAKWRENLDADAELRQRKDAEITPTRDEIRDANDKRDDRKAREKRNKDMLPTAEQVEAEKARLVEPKATLARGDRFTDKSGQEFEVWKNRQGTIEAHPVIDGKPVVNRESGVRFSVTEEARARNPDDRTDIAAGDEPKADPPASPSKKKDGVTYQQAKVGGEVSPVNGEFYKGGHWMPIHGLSPKVDKSKPPKSKGNGPPEAGKGKDKPPREPRREMSAEQIEAEKQRRETAAKWDGVRTGPLASVLWVGEKPGKTGFDVKKQMVPFLTSLKPEEVKAIAEHVKAKAIERERPNFENHYGAGDEADRELNAWWDDAKSNTAAMLLKKKDLKAFPGLDDAVEGLREFSHPNTGQVSLEEFVQLDGKLRELLK